MAAAEPIRLAVTPGDPAGIGPDLIVELAASGGYSQLRQQFRERFHGAELALVIIADGSLLQQRARLLGKSLDLIPFVDASSTGSAGAALQLLQVSLGVAAQPGVPESRNGPYVLATLEQAVAGCQARRFHGMVTGPVNKALINEGGTPFTGHTEWLARRTGAPLPVMMLATEGMRVAFATTHLPLRQVADAITMDLLLRVIRIVHLDLQEKLGIPSPRILVCGLNPHAGEGGHLGREEIDVIEPAIRRLAAEGINVTGPLPADTVFTPHHLSRTDVVLSMYHDQGSPPLKQIGFGRALNVTLGLPIIRTSVDHGTAFDLAGSGKADPGSLLTAIRYACAMAKHQGGWL